MIDAAGSRAQPQSQPARAPRLGTLLAFDFGLKRIGVACGELATRLAHPLSVICYRNREDCFAQIAAIVREWRPERLVVGLPSREDGTRHELAAAVERFAGHLTALHRLPVEFVDERLSSAAAATQLREAGARRRGRAKHLDAEAARIILETYFSALDQT